MSGLPNRPLSLNEVADYLGCSHWTVRRMIARGDLRAFKVGAMIRVHPADLRKAMRPVTPLGEEVAR